MAGRNDTRGTQHAERRGIGRRAIVTLSGMAAGAGLVAAVARPAAGSTAIGAPEAPQTGTDDGTRPTAHRDAYFRRARF
jgi:hypothetical protein